MKIFGDMANKSFISINESVCWILLTNHLKTL